MSNLPINIFPKKGFLYKIDEFYFECFKIVALCTQRLLRIQLSHIKEYVKFLNRLYDLIWFGAVYA